MSNTNATILDLGVNFTIIEAEEPKNYKMIYEELPRDSRDVIFTIFEVEEPARDTSDYFF